MAHLGTFLAMDQLLQQAGAERTVDIFSVALQQSQACGLMTPTLVRGHQGLVVGGGGKGVGKVLGATHRQHYLGSHQAVLGTMMLPDGTRRVRGHKGAFRHQIWAGRVRLLTPMPTHRSSISTSTTV